MKHRSSATQGTLSLACHCNNDDSGLWGLRAEIYRGLCDRLDPHNCKRAVHCCQAGKDLEEDHYEQIQQDIQALPF